MRDRDLIIRPLSLGEIIDRAVALTIRHFRALFAAMLVLEAPALALARVQAVGLSDLLASLQSPAAAAATLRRLSGTFATLLVVLLALQLLATAICAALVAPSLQGDAGAPIPRARRVGAVARAAAAHVLLLVAAPVAGAAPGVLLAIAGPSFGFRVAGAAGAVLGSVALFLVALLRLLLAPAAAAVEAGPGLAALARSARLMGPRPGTPLGERPGVRAAVLLLATFVLALAVNGLAGLPRAAAARAVGGGSLGLLPGTLPLGAEIGLGLFEAVASAALQPFSLVAVAVFYFDRRARTEGLDLEAWARSLGGAP